MGGEAEGEEERESEEEDEEEEEEEEGLTSCLRMRESASMRAL